MIIPDIDELTAPLLSKYKSALSSITDSDIALIGDINRHIGSREGKQLRPTLMLLTAKCCGFDDDDNPGHPIYKVAAAIETLHNSTLIHDDVVDESSMRRGAATVNQLWGNKAAVLAGDYYLAQVMYTINSVDDKRITSIINQTAVAMSEGELLQLQNCGNYGIDDIVYFDIIKRKTASFMAACCSAGATLTSADPSTIEQARIFGEKLGMAFQVRDDIIDFKPSAESGKPTGNDIKERKCTLPLIMTLRNVDKATGNEIVSMMGSDSLDNKGIEKIIGLVRQHGIPPTQEILKTLADEALEALDGLPANKYRDAMRGIAEKIKKN